MTRSKYLTSAIRRERLRKKEPKVLLAANPPYRPHFHTFVLLDDGRVLRRGHFFNPGKPDPRTEVEYQNFGTLPAYELEAKFRTWAARCDLEIAK